MAPKKRLTLMGILFSFLMFLFSDKSILNAKQNQFKDEDEFEFPKLIPMRASSAPPRPLTEIEEFR
jgi:hypothetical protein